MSETMDNAARHRRRAFALDPEDDVKFRLFDRAITQIRQSSRPAVGGIIVTVAIVLTAIVGTVFTVSEVLNRLNY